MKRYARILVNGEWSEIDRKYGMNTNEAYEIAEIRELSFSNDTVFTLINHHLNVKHKETYFHCSMVEEITTESHPEYFL